MDYLITSRIGTGKTFLVGSGTGVLGVHEAGGFKVEMASTTWSLESAQEVFHRCPSAS
jgi:hypothetical protein